MKNMLKRLVRICTILWLVLVILTTIGEIVKYTTGGYVQVDATVTYVNYFVNRSSHGGSYNRANGYLEWEYDGLTCVSIERVGLPADAKVGDTKTIWIDAKTGEYTILQGLFYALFGLGVHILICVMVLKFVKVKKPVKVQAENVEKMEEKNDGKFEY